MRNPFAKPRTTGQWLLGSVCWLVVCVNGWWMIAWLLGNWPATQAYGVLFLPICFVLAQWLLWTKAIRSGWALIGYEAATVGWWLKLLAYVWFSVLVLQQITTLTFLTILLVWAH